MYLILWLVCLSLSCNVGFAQEEDDDAAPRIHDPKFTAEIVANGFVDPTAMAFIDSNDIMVVEKNKGTVRLIIDGQMLDEPLLDVNINARDERGLLGIAIADNNSNANPYVFLYYTEAEGDDEGNPIGNRL